ncbi:MAG: hypothetical protein CM1200mP16_10380 [Nitrospina sp.]|nr:MAG: hypothetical protein CM1200mP16_10380 [Nitrospina sp.]
MLRGKYSLRGNPSPNTLVFLEKKNKNARKGAKQGEVITIHQSGLNFQPTHSIIQVGTTVNFSNQTRKFIIFIPNQWATSSILVPWPQVLSSQSNLTLPAQSYCDAICIKT